MRERVQAWWTGSELKISRNFLLGTGFAAEGKGLANAWQGSRLAI
jgi:hypothetical protein